MLSPVLGEESCTGLFPERFAGPRKWFRRAGAQSQNYAVGLEMRCPGGTCLKTRPCNPPWRQQQGSWQAIM